MLLKYGQTIRIKSYERIKGYITSKSYTDSNLYFQIYNQQNNYIENISEVTNIENYRESLFQILPISSFQINDEMNSMKSQAKKAQSLPRAKTEQEQFKAIVAQKKGNLINFGDKVVFKHLDSQYYIYGSFDCAKSGIGAFKLQLRPQLSEKLIFQLHSYRTYEKDGDEISLDAPLRIYHIQTQCYLSYVQENIFIDRVYDYDRQGNIYKLDIIPYPYIKTFKLISHEQNYQNNSRVSHQSVINLPQAGRYEIINQNIAKRVWRLQEHLQMQMKPNRQQIRNHDVVFFIHTKDDKYLCPDNFTNKVYLQKRRSEADIGQMFDGLWEIQQRKQFDEKTQDFNKSNARKKNPASSMRSGFGTNALKSQIGGKNFQEEESITEKISNEKYIIRHLISGRIMYASLSYDTAQLQPFSRDSSNKPMLFECVDSKLIDGALVRFKVKLSSKKSKSLCVKKPIKKNKIPKVSNSIDDDMGQDSEQIQDEQLDQIQKTYQSYFQKQEVQLINDASEHGFRIYKVDEQIKKTALFIMSSQQLLCKVTNFIENFDSVALFIKDISVYFLNTIIYVMRSLIGFVYDCQYHKIQQSGNSPIIKRQRAFVELGMIQLVTHLVNKINEKSQQIRKISQFPYHKQSQFMKIRNIYVLGYQILQCIAANNYTIKIRISKYLKKYLEHIKKPENRVVYKSLQQVLDDNYLALQKKIDQFYIKELINSFSQGDPDPYNLIFLSRLCLCKERTVAKNQNAIFQYFYKNQQGGQDEKKTANKFKFREDQGKMQIASKISQTQQAQYRTLPQMYEQCEISQMQAVIDPEKGHWNYFLEYLNLLADVCVHRNNNPHKYILDNLPLKTLVYFLNQPVVKKKLLFQPFIRLVHHAFIENAKYEQMNRITKVKNWNELDYFQIPKSKEDIGSQIERILEYIKQYIVKINQSAWQAKSKKKKVVTVDRTKQFQLQQQPINLQFDPQDPSKLKIVKTFLQIFKSTLTLGFWPSMQSLKQIVPYMLKILSFDIEYANRQLQNVKEIDLQNNQNRHLTEDDYKERVYSMIKQQLTLNKTNINNLVQCKLIAAEIIDIISDYQYNIKVSMITKYFKDVIEMQIDLSKYAFDRLKFLKKWYTNKQFSQFVPQNQKQRYLMIEEIWIDKIKEMIEKRDLFSQAKILDKYLVFFETFIYENKDLSNLILSIMTKISNQRKNILNTFRNIIIVAGGSLSNLANRVLVTRSILLTLSNFKVRETTISSTKNDLWGIIKVDSRQPAQVQDKSLGAIQQLAFLTIAMKKSCKPTALKASKFYQESDLYPFRSFYQTQGGKQAYKSDKSYLIISEKQQNNPLNQNLIKGQDHHLIIIQFIKIMTQIPDQFPLPIKALHAAYNFLTVLVWNNIENKQQLCNLDILKIAQCHLPINVGCIDFYRQMFTNNKTLVLKSDVSALVHKIIEIANNQQMHHYHKSKLMDFLRILVIFDEQGIQKNQNIVMQIISLYQVSENNNIVYLKTSNELSDFIERNYKSWIDDYMNNYEQSMSTCENLNVSSELFYVATFFEIFGALIENQNVVNIGKCNNMHPLQFLLDKLQKAKYCWPIIRHLRAYINKLYYFKDRQLDSQYFDMFLNRDLQNIKSQLRGIVQLKYNCPQNNTIKIQNPIRYSYLSSYVYLSLQQILHSLDLMLSHKGFDTYIQGVFNQVQTPKNPLHFRLLQIVQMLQFLLKTIDGRYINAYLNTVSKQLRAILSSITLDIVEQFNAKTKQQITENMKNKLNFDDVPFKKRYIFHESKGFWKHLIDWNSFHEQQMIRDKAMNTIQKKSEKDVSGGQSKQSELQKKKQYLLQWIYLGNIEKKIWKQMNRKRNKQHQEIIEQEQVQQQISTQAALPKNLVTSKSSRFRIKNERFSNLEVKNAVINNRRKKLVKFIEINPEFKAFSRQQTQSTLYQMFNQLDTCSKNMYGMQVIGKQDVIKSIVKMNKLNSNSIKPQYKLVIIRLLTNFVARQSKIFQNKIGQADFSSISNQEKTKILEAQQFLNECGCSQLVCSLLMNDFTISTKMGINMLLFAIMMLIGKNKNVQNSMLQILKNDDKNIIFVELQKKIKDCTEVVCNNAIDPVEKQYIQVRNYSDTYDFFNNEDNCMIRKFKFQPITIMEQREFTQKFEFLQTAFIFLKVLCQGNNSQLKNYIRQQTYNDQQKKIKQQSVNFIGLGVSQLKKIFEKISSKIIKVSFSIVDFINEVTQIPCIKNQLFLCESSFFHDFCNLSIHLQQTKAIQFNKQNLSILMKFYSLNFKNLISCLEGNQPEVRDLLTTQDLSIYYVRAFKFSIDNLPISDQTWQFKNFIQLQRLMLNRQHHTDLIIDLFQITTVVQKLKHLTSLAQSNHFEKKIDYQLQIAHMKQYFSVFERNMLGIEVHMDSFDKKSDQGQNQLIFFPKHTVFNYLSRQTRATLMQSINRSTHRDKIIGLVKATHDITQQITYGYYLDHDYKIYNMNLSISSNKIQIYKTIALIISTLLCFLLSVFAVVIYYPQDQTIQYYLGNKSQFMRILALAQFSFASIYFVLWLKNRVRLAVKRYQRKKRQGQADPQSKMWQFLFKINFIKYLFCLVQFDKQFSDTMLFMAGSFLGTFYRLQCFSILLINLMMSQMDVLKNVIAAITTNMKMLGMLSMLGTAFVAIFSIFSLHYYVNSLYPDQIPKSHCQTVLDCIVELYIRQQIGNDMQKFESGRFFFDMLYTIFMDTLFGNIVGGVLIDTFAQLRDKRNEIQTDKKGFCFICGIKRQILQKKNQDLKTHYKKQYHKLWNYVFYLYHLYNKVQKTGLENIIEQKVKVQDVSWIPTQGDQQVDIGTKIYELQEQIKKQSDFIMKVEVPSM